MPLRTWKRLIIYCVSFIGVFFIGTAIDVACGPEPDPYDYYISFFHNNLHKDDSYSPFYFNGYTFLNGYSYDIDNDNKGYEQNLNVAEWIRYVDGAVKPKDTYKILYLLDNKTDSLYFWNYSTISKRFPDSLETNTFIKALNRNKQAMTYLALAKKTEPLVTQGDRWDDKSSWNKNKQHEFALKYIEDGKKVNDKFLKLRYFYQAQRLLHYGRYFKEAGDVYDKYLKSSPSASHIKNWALGLKAGEEEQLGRNTQAAYLYSREFALCPERRVQAYYDFRDTKVPIEQVIKTTKNNAEKAVIYGMEGFHQPRIDLRPLLKVYRTNSRSEMVSILLAREINKIEEGYLTPKINGNKYYDSIGYWDHTKYDSLKTSFKNYIPKLKAFCNRLATENKYPEPGLGYLASAYLSWIQHDPQAGFNELAALENKPMRGKLDDERQMINLLLLSQSIKKLDSTTENKLLPSLTWLDKKVKQESALKIDGNRYWSEYDLKYYSASSRDFYAKVLARLYFKQRDTAMAALCILRSERTILVLPGGWDFYPEHGLGFDMPVFWQTSMHSYHFEKILRWEHAAVKTPYLKLLMAEFRRPEVKRFYRWDPPPNGNKIKSVITKPEMAIVPGIYDLLGTAYLREHKYNLAIKAFKHIDIKKLEFSTADDYNDSLSKHYNRYTNPFIDSLHDYQRTFSTRKQEGYNKLAYAKSMAKLEVQIRTNPKAAAACYYKMANGLYNTSYYGNAWFYTAYSWANADKYRTKGFYYDNGYLRERKAEACFLKARQLSSNPEFKARCTFMAAKCRQKQVPYADYYGNDRTQNEFDLREKRGDLYDKKVHDNFYFKDLRKNFSKTHFYKTAIDECSYFRDFLYPHNVVKKN